VGAQALEATVNDRKKGVPGEQYRLSRLGPSSRLPSPTAALGWRISFTPTSRKAECILDFWHAKKSLVELAKLMHPGGWHFLKGPWLSKASWRVILHTLPAEAADAAQPIRAAGNIGNTSSVYSRGPGGALHERTAVESTCAWLVHHASWGWGFWWSGADTCADKSAVSPIVSARPQPTIEVDAPAK